MNLNHFWSRLPLSRVGNSIIFFWANRSFFVIERAKLRFHCEKSELLSSLFCKDWRDWIWLIHSRSLFFKDQRDWFAHGCSFLKINEMESLTVALFSRLTRAKIERSKELIPNPAFILLQTKSVFFMYEKLKMFKRNKTHGD